MSDPRASDALRSPQNPEIQERIRQGYKYGFVSDIEADAAPPGLSEDIVRFISAKKGEPDWLTTWRLEAYRRWRTQTEPTWQNVTYNPIDYEGIVYYSAPKKKPTLQSLDEVDPEIRATFDKLGISLEEQKRLSGVAVDAVLDSASVVTTYKEKLAEVGVIFCSMSEAVREHPELVQKYLGSVVPIGDNFFATLNSAVFSDGSFVYIPEGVKCPLELSTYFRINAANTGQFERTLIIAERGSSVSLLEGRTAPLRGGHPLAAAVVCKGARSHISWTQVETGSAVTWKYPSCVLAGDGSIGEFYSVALTNNRQQADTGTKMVHVGKNTRSTIISKGISAGRGQNTYRGQVKVYQGAEGARNYSQCDSLLIGDRCGAHTFPYLQVNEPTAHIEHEASTSKVSEDQLFYCRQRGLSTEDAVSMIVNGFCKEVFKELPMEFAVEAQKLLEVSLEGTVG